MKRRVIVEIISSLLIILFVYTTLSKVFDYDTFRSQLGKSPFITSFASTIAWALPAAELLLALLLALPDTRLLGLYVSLFTMTLFTAYIYAMLHFSYYIPCSCGGVISEMSWNQHMVFNLFFVAISIAGILLESRLVSHTIPAKEEQLIVFT
jgi:hypothetical protein